MIENRLLTVRETANLLGLKPGTVYLYLRTHQIGFIRVGRWAVRVPQSEVQRLLQLGHVPAVVSEGAVAEKN